MKKIKQLFMILATAAISVTCSEEKLDSNSIFTTTETIENDFDRWILRNYIEPYNINFKYRLDDKETNQEYNLIPASYAKSIALAKMVKFLWIDSYEELLGTTFIRTYCPKVMQLIGSVGYKSSSGSVVLGEAEGGLKITLYDVNKIDPSAPDIEFLNDRFFHTMHHEFAHILHQKKNYSTDFNLISASNYQSSSWVNVSAQNALNMGFVSPYASSETQEDFVEIISLYVTKSAAEWNALVAKANAEGQSIIKQKLAFVKDYLTVSWGIDLDKLRDIVQRRSAEVLTMDLVTLN